MRRAIFLFIFAVMILAVTDAFVCTKNFCDNVKCSEELTKETCHGQFIPNSSTCGCCPTCVTYIKPFGSCNSLLNHIRGPVSIFQRRCPPHFICVRNRCSPLL